MKKKLFEKGIIKGMIPYVIVIVLISAVFQACQKDDILQNVNPETEAIQPNQLKSATITTDDIDALIQKAENLITNPNLEPGLANAFVVKLENAKKSVEKGNEKASVNQLQALLNQLEGLVKAGAVESTIVEELISEIKLNVGENSTFTDPRDNHEYKTIKIGDQVWMAENLAYLPIVTSSMVPESRRDEEIYHVIGYNGIDVDAAKATTNYATYGVLYNWLAAKNSCPPGWHMPSDAEWQQLSDFLINNGYGYGGSGNNIAKALAATTSWDPVTGYDTEGTPGNDPLSNNSSGFSGLASGYDYYGPSSHSIYLYQGQRAFWWSSSANNGGKIWWLYYAGKTLIQSTGIYNDGYSNGYSVRCVRD